MLLRRDESMGGINVPIEQTITKTVKHAKSKKINFDYIFEISYSRPFLTVRDLETSINMLEFFKTDQVISVKAETDLLFQHDGRGLKPLQKMANLKLEREEIFRSSGSLKIVRKKFINNSNPKIKKIGHVITNEKASFGINTDLDFLIANNVLSKRI